SWRGLLSRDVATLAKAFRPLVRSSSPFVDPPREKNATWLEPRPSHRLPFRNGQLTESCGSQSFHLPHSQNEPQWNPACAPAKFPNPRPYLIYRIAPAGVPTPNTQDSCQFTKVMQ